MDITFIVGAGAVENSWDPVIRAIENTYGLVTNRDGANFLMARDVYLLRVYSTFAARDHYPEVYAIMKSNIDRLKQNIASELHKAQEAGEIKARSILQKIVDKFTNKEFDKIAVVSANWDNVIDTAINKLYRWGKPDRTRNIDCYHIHGTINDSRLLYLPSETTMETYRTKTEEHIFGNYHSNFMSLLQNTNKTLLYGISLDPLDAELNVSLASGWQSTNNEEIIIINPEHSKVAARVKLLSEAKAPVKITGYDPCDLSKGITYK